MAQLLDSTRSSETSSQPKVWVNGVFPLRLARLTARAGQTIRRLYLLGWLAPLIAAIWLWTISLQQVDLSRMTDLGLVSVLPLSVYAAVLLLTISFTLAIRQRRIPATILLLYVGTLIFMIHGMPNILYGTLRYAWAWKHVGIVDYIQRHGSVDPNIYYLNAYHNWPGFFALSALLTEAAGFKSALSFAGWGPVFFNLIDLGALLLIFNSITQDRRLIWLSVWFFYLANWIGQDYFSPQAMTYFLYLVMMGICLTWFRVTRPPAKATLKRWLLFDPVVSIVQGLVSFVATDDSPETTSRPLLRLGLMAIVIMLFIAVASSHQLTPFMAISATLALVVFQRCNARSLPVLLGVLAGLWIIYMAVDFMRHGNIVWVIQSIGNLFGNVNANLIDLSRASPGQRFVAIMSRSLTAFVGILAIMGGIRRLRFGYWDLAFMLLVISPFPLIVGNSYGGEMLFRIYLFALPFVAFFAAALLYPSPVSGGSRWIVVLTILLSVVLLVGFSFAYYGKERMFYFSQDEVKAAEYLYDTAPQGALLIDGTVNYPWGFKDYEYYTYTSLTEMPKRAIAALLGDPIGVIAAMMSDKQYTTAYLIITRSQKANIEMVGLMPPGSLDRIEQTLAQSPQFKVVYANKDAEIFTLARRTEK